MGYYITINKRLQTYFNLSILCIIFSISEEFTLILPFFFNLVLLLHFKKLKLQHWRYLLMTCTLAIFITFLLLVVQVNFFEAHYNHYCIPDIADREMYFSYSINTLLFSVIIWEGSFLSFRSILNR